VRFGARIRYIFYENVGSTPVTTIINNSPYEEVIKRYRNQAYFIDDGTFVSFNLDNGEYIIKDLCESYNLPPRIIDAVNLTANYLTMLYRFNGIDGIGMTTVPNERDLTSVYKLTYNYSERTFPYQITSDRFIFNLQLQNNNPITDMEIFKYVIDLKIRYTKDKAVVNPARPIKEGGDTGDKRRFVKKNRAIGDAEKVLGYVDDDFNVSTFLNIYNHLNRDTF
jgi:hypothetical protein